MDHAFYHVCFLATDYIHHLEQALTLPPPSTLPPSVVSGKTHAPTMAIPSTIEMAPVLLPLDSFSDANAQCI